MLVVHAEKIGNGGTSLTVVPHICGICKKAFLQESSLLEHFQTHEKTLSSVESNKSHSEEIKFEIPAAEEKIIKKDVERLTTSDIVDNNSEKRLPSCDICKRSFSSKTYLLKHIKLHKGERCYQCDICNKSFVLKDNLVKHFSTHDPDKKRFFCLECGKGFTSRQYKEKHELIHLGEKPHVCGICDRAFTLKTNLNKHILIHSEERYQHVCSVCNKGFSSKAYLEKHHLIHSGEKPHVCGVCHKAFTLKTNLHKHYLIHTGYRRFGCEVCSKRFKTKGSLEQHYTVHSGERPFTCKKCLLDFKQKAHLDKHMQTHIDLVKVVDQESEIMLSEIIIGEQETNENYDTHFTDTDRVNYYDIGTSDSKNSRSFNVITDSLDGNISINELVLVQQHR